MSENNPVDFKALAEALVRRVADRLRKQGNDDRTGEWVRLSTELARSGKFVELSEAHLRTIIDAVEYDLRQPAGTVERRTRAWASAIIAITETAPTIAPAVEALNPEMHATDGCPDSDISISPPAKKSSTAYEFGVLVDEYAHLCSAVGYVQLDRRRSIPAGPS